MSARLNAPSQDFTDTYGATLDVTDSLARLLGRLDAARKYGCDLTLDDIAAHVEDTLKLARVVRDKVRP